MKKWEFIQQDNFNTVRQQRDGSLLCDCVDFALFEHCPHIRYVELRHAREEEAIKICASPS